MHKSFKKPGEFASTYHHYILLSAVVLAGFLLRIWGIWNIENQDEYNEVFEALRVCSGNLNFERWGKRFYLYVLSIAYGIYYSIGWLFQQFSSPLDFAEKMIRNMDPLFIIGRSISAVFGTASVYLTYQIGRSLFNSTVGIIAALFLCFSVLSIEVSHYATVDSALCFSVLMAFYFIQKFMQEKGITAKYYILAGLFSGIALQNKAPAIILFLPFLLAHVYKTKEKGSFFSIFSKNLGYYILAYCLGLVIGNPAVIIAPNSFLMSFFGYTRVYTTPTNLTQSVIGYVAYLSFLYKEMGLLLSSAVILSLICAFFSKNRNEVLLLSFIVPFYLLIGASKFMVYTRYIAPLMPLLYIICARYLSKTLQSLKLKQNYTKVLMTASCLVLMISSVLNITKFEKVISGKNTRILAKEWIEENIPSGSKILMDTGKSINTFGPKIAQNRDSITRLLKIQENAIKNNDKFRLRGLVTQDSLIYYELLLKNVPEISYDITSTMFGLKVKSINYYLSKQFQYFIISNNMKKRAKSDLYLRKYPEVSEFYNSLDSDKRIKLIKTIVPTNRNKGLKFYIYQLLPASI